MWPGGNTTWAGTPATVAFRPCACYVCCACRACRLQDIMPGCAIKMQLCLRANSLEDTFTRMKGKPFVTEVKLDGYRLQVQ